MLFLSMLSFYKVVFNNLNLYIVCCKLLTIFCSGGVITNPFFLPSFPSFFSFKFFAAAHQIIWTNLPNDSRSFQKNYADVGRVVKQLFYHSNFHSVGPDIRSYIGLIWLTLWFPPTAFSYFLICLISQSYSLSEASLD